MSHDKEIVLSAQKKAKTNDPTPDDIFAVGTIGQIIQLLRLPDGTVKVLVEGKRRARIRKFVPNEEFFLVEVEELAEPNEKSVEIEALMRSVHQTFENYVKLNKRIPPEMLISVQTIDDPARLADTIVARAVAQARRQAGDPRDRVADQAAREALRADAGRDRDPAGREEDPDARQEADGEDAEGVLPQRADAGDPEGARRARRVQERDPGARREDQEQEDVEGGAHQGAQGAQEAQDDVADERGSDRRAQLHRLGACRCRGTTRRRTSSTSPRRRRSSTRITTACRRSRSASSSTSPCRRWCRSSRGRFCASSDRRASARRRWRSRSRARPGGASCACRSAACATRRRSAATGARTSARCPGKIIQSLKKAGSNNPVFLLDEVDKMSTDFRGDPSAALLEVLDPEQNSTFNDHYLDLDYDLSDVMFITTANSLHSIPVPLQDRMEIIQLPGYTEWEKVSIAEQYLIPKEKEQNGVKDIDVEFTEDAIRTDHPPLHQGGGRPQPRARDLDGAAARSPRTWSSAGQGRPKFRITPTERSEVPRRAQVPRRPARGEGRDRPVQRPGGDHARRRHPAVGGHGHAGQGQADADRQARRRDAGVGAGGDELHPLARRVARAVERLLREGRHPHPLPRGRDPQGRPVGGRDHGDGAGVGAACASRCARTWR